MAAIEPCHTDPLNPFFEEVRRPHAGNMAAPLLPCGGTRRRLLICPVTRKGVAVHGGEHLAKLLTFILCGLLVGESIAEERSDRPDFQKPILYTTTLMAVGLGALVATGIPDSGPSINNFVGAYQSGPRRDDDSALFNYVLHPLWGSETYLRAREANFGVPGSVAFSLAASVAWEYLFESWVQHPSTQDLIITTSAGSLLGELRHQIKRRTTERVHWWIDPIDSTLRRLRIGFGKDRFGEAHWSVRVAWKY